jgi:hypothetical protein
MEKRTCKDPNDDPRGSVEPAKAVTVTVTIFRVSEQATEKYIQLAMGSVRGEVYDEVGTVGTR